MKTHVRGKVLLVALLAAATFGCGSKGGGAGVPDSAKGGMAMLPGDADLYVGLDGAAARSSDLYKKFAPMMMKKAGGDVADFKAKCGMDPAEKINTVVAAVKGTPDDPEVTLTVSGVTKDEAFGCIQKLAASGAVKVDGDYLEYHDGDGTTGVLAVGDLLLVHGGKHAKVNKDDLVALSKLPADKSAAGSASLTALLNKVNSGATMWIAAKGDSAFVASSPLPVKFKAGAISFKITDGIGVEVSATLSNEAEAKEMVDKVKDGFQQAKTLGVLDDSEAEANGADIHIKVSMSADQIKKVMSMAGGMGGMGE